jgi:hypothetical protein
MRAHLIKLISILFFLYVLPAAAEEHILDFTSEITVNSDSSLNVRETIRVNSEGTKIRRGIYRDFPTRYTNPYGVTSHVDFVVLEVLRDGKPETYRTESQANGVRTYIGKKDYFLPRGKYTYTIFYKTTRQVGFFKDHDELYWNVTGNGWDFPIDHASAIINLPESIPTDSLRLEAYTGPTGSKDKDYQSKINREGHPLFQTTNALEPKEGLTIVVGWPKGFIKEPDEKEKLLAAVYDNRSLILGAIAFLILIFYYLSVWNLYGRDPKKGIIIPRFEPPKNFSPAGVRYLANMGFDNKIIACAVINMAAKGYLKIKE